MWEGAQAKPTALLYRKESQREKSVKLARARFDCCTCVVGFTLQQIALNLALALGAELLWDGHLLAKKPVAVFLNRCVLPTRLQGAKLFPMPLPLSLSVRCLFNSPLIAERALARTVAGAVDRQCRLQRHHRVRIHPPQE